MSSFTKELSDELRDKVKKITDAIPEALTVFEQVYTVGQKSGRVSEPDNKRRKVDDSDLLSVSNENVVFELQDVSVLSPLRKKLTMSITLDEKTQLPMITLSKNNNIEFILPDIKNTVKFGTFLPFPEKKNLIYLFIFYERDQSSSDPILITLNKDHILKQFRDRNLLRNDEADFQDCIDYMRRQAILTGFRISDPLSKVVMDSHHSFFVDCHRGSKEGTLFFLPEHIIFGFKKPILLFESHEIDAITYSSITRLTFNATLMTKSCLLYTSRCV